MKYMDSNERFELIQSVLVRYSKLGAKLNKAVEDKSIWDAPKTRDSWKALVRILSLIDLMGADMSIAIAESENLDEEWYRSTLNTGKDKAIGELRQMQAALVDLLGKVELKLKLEKAG